ncbi:MAG: aminotransferase class I/II-fold pyridoxal phosphate-dependent enzyme [Ignavibacteriae bacterium]|nr:aminotransferase class I/II-fold pyridoxal phosphate-dependent enzyme [Ignavibacteriota bacterium]
MTQRLLSSEYMHWVKTLSGVRYNLAISGMVDYPLSEIPYQQEDLLLSGAGSYGYEPLKQIIAQQYSVSADSVVTTLGASMANYLVMALLLKPGDEVLIEYPAYELLVSAAKFLGADVKRFMRRFDYGFHINPEEIKKTITPKTRLIVLTNLHNPTSVYTDELTLLQVGDIARSVNAHVLVGEVYLTTMFDKSFFTAASLGKEFITTNSLTKAYGLSGMRLGWILAEPEITNKLWRLIDLLYVNQTTLSERLGVRAFQQIDKLATRSRTILDQNRVLLYQFLSSRNELNCVLPSDGTIVFPRLKRGNVDELSELLRTKYETAFVPGKFFDMPHHFRLGLCGKPELFAEGLKRLGMALDELHEKNSTIE